MAQTFAAALRCANGGMTQLWSMEMELFNDTKRYNSLLTIIRNSGKKFGEAVHLYGFNALMHVENTGDVTYCQRLHNALTPVARAAFVRWACAFGKVKYDNKAAKFGYAKAATTDTDFISACGPMEWQKPKADRQSHTFDFAAALKALLAKADKNGVEATNKAREYLVKAVGAAA